MTTRERRDEEMDQDRKYPDIEQTKGAEARESAKKENRPLPEWLKEPRRERSKKG